MNVIVLIAAAALAALGALLFALDYIGWGLALWVGAAVVSQSVIMAEVWRDLRERRPTGARPWAGPWHAGDLVASIQRVLAKH
ncbi:hypothetical protein G8A07_14780 [Roseateles sp. DAIF2]|uniref:hypothetical protein n=1 Tax=Roseateles sp. DAIF2 TaxID=2714952 RepID=UPI0018A2D405|nr:hypothetical protein [Roseateles sp. DAIF2]QPF74055.1 hypothetical protein G8A07_14780 [Roseateles sp. DAIF2]